MQSEKGRVLPIRYDDLQALRATWMPFILSGAVFVPDIDDGFLGERIFLLLLLPGARQRIAVDGRVVWVNPPGAVARRGIGVQLRETDGAAKTAIENCLQAAPADDVAQPLFLEQL